MVHGLAETEVGGEGERADEVGQPDAAVRRRLHVVAGHLRDRPAGDLWGEPRTTARGSFRTVAREDRRTGGRHVNHE